MNVYLAGPMRRLPGLNHAAFHDAAAKLRAAGHEVFSPAEADVAQGIGPHDAAEAESMIRHLLGADLAWITSTADIVVCLPGWEQSRGVAAERATALAIGIPVAELDEFLNGGAS